MIDGTESDLKDTGSGHDSAGEQTGWEDLPLSPQHKAVLVASGITPEQARLRGYETILDGQRLHDQFWFEERVADRAPGLLIPRLDVNRQVWGYLFRPDRTDFAGRYTAAKYEARPGDPYALDIPPGVDAVMLGDPDKPLWLTEGVKKADCGAAHGLCIIDVSGVWEWVWQYRSHHHEFALPDWNEIFLNRRKVIVCYDNKQVSNSMSSLARFLKGKGARVSCVWLSDTDTKTGLDDYLQDHTVGELHQLILPFDQEPGEEPRDHPSEDDPDGLIAAADELLRRDDLVAAVVEIRELLDKASDKFGDAFYISPHWYRELDLIETLQAQILPATGDRDAFVSRADG